MLGNHTPTADAGPDQSVRGAAIVALDGTASSDTDGHIARYAWQQTAGTPVILSGAGTAIPSFTAPRLPEAQVLSFALTVTDNLGAQATATVHITVLGNEPPSAHAGADQTVPGGSSVGLDARGSTDPDGSIIAYTWSQTGGPAVSLIAGTRTDVIAHRERLAGASTSRARFTAPYVATDTRLRFELTVTDTEGLSAEDTVDIVVQPNAQGTDTQAPITRLLTTPLRFGATVYYPVLLSANEPATTYLRVSDPSVVSLGALKTTEWQVYRGPLLVMLTAAQTLTVEYYSIDSAGNQESIKTRVLQ